MLYNVDKDYIINCFKTLVNVPSPVGFDLFLKPVLEGMCKELGYELSYDNRDTAYISIDGEDNSKTVMISAHADTIGFVVKGIDGNGVIRIKALGGMNIHTVEGSNVSVITRSGKIYTGICMCQSHSTHAFSDAISLERSDKTLMVLLDEPVKSKEDVKALGIRNGDLIALDPGCVVTDNGYIKSRFIDDKGAIACVLAALKYMKENSLKPKYNTLISFPYNEELGLGGTYIPQGVSEFLAVDIGLIAPNLDGDERSVSICSMDATVTYDYKMTSELISKAERAGCSYAVNTYLRYGSDAGAAVKAGNNLRYALCGMAVYGSHGVERTHIDGLENTTALILAYLMDL
ncbi:MAG: M42 family metallopeptidase [Ruminococcaceae bacterium]|nr:M42 family metallopeptidase [Oscillospiraceae bacterium]